MYRQPSLDFFDTEKKIKNIIIFEGKFWSYKEFFFPPMTDRHIYLYLFTMHMGANDILGM